VVGVFSCGLEVAEALRHREDFLLAEFVDEQLFGLGVLVVHVLYYIVS
jgi:hypothetical protein